MPGMLCMAKMASQGKRSNRPSSMRFSRPPPPSSAGWKIRFSVPSKPPCLRQVLRRGQQHGGVAVVAAGVHHAVVAAAPVGRWLR
jgi:hypothetical protein